MIKPTIGRVVWYWSDAAALNTQPDAQPCPALVAKVIADDRVNLAAFDEIGHSFPRPGVFLWQGEGERPQSEYCEWMPYQKTQAANQAGAVMPPASNSAVPVPSIAVIGSTTAVPPPLPK